MTKADAGKLGGKISTIYKNVRIKAYLKNPNKCKNCDTNIPYDKRYLVFCNKSCSATYNNVGVRRHGRGKIKCNNCETETYNEKFCSNKCQQQSNHINLLDKFEKGLIVFSQTQHKLLVELRGNFCEKCKNDGTWLGRPLKLQVDHKDGDSDNNFPINLRLLCPNCHTQTPNWGMRNLGKGRRRKIKGPGI